MVEDILSFTGITENLKVEYNVSDYGNDSFYQKREFYNVIPVWPVYIEVSNIMDDNTASGDLENKLTLYPDINGSAGIWQPINSTDHVSPDSITEIIINSFVVITCLLGLVGNGMVIWLLGFCMKRNPFTTYILNLSIADFGVLVFLISTAALGMSVGQYNEINIHTLFFLISLELFFLTYSASQYLLAAISIDRSVAVLFPLWHRCHRPPCLSPIVCTLTWILSFVLSAIHFTLHRTKRFGNTPLLYPLIVNVLICTPIMVTSTLILFIQLWCKTKQHPRGKLVTSILLALLFFLIFAFPLNVFYIINHYHTSLHSLMVAGFVCASLNSCINPLIYFLIGRRQKKGQPRVSVKVALQRVFKDEHDHNEEQNNSSVTTV
ncbi:mas-related G-protein coupled receptor member H [Anolis carolinensis]|uniref:G-protein coupled receptors family 1 profile domain-containing protein n=1 Tax=Anolis carolinensis TaxID=28377 RepID=G1K8B0_ANOCA|nr:PREDICTED: mas-related G-protein coupled receptor member H [Anolis carolinensis]XP_008106534.1 PREDICTED: mas-related G-protein coupled receptor member H [Anolis carolinensis]XP_008106535.1 PREDICTED: mas-related G-protein coupled receptor member H [Anolis carolinensis]|eukprot:XP_003219532.1 PREDICTED: mas-related G-protein coupled receptor member H [Anolis carolinensis]